MTHRPKESPQLLAQRQETKNKEGIAIADMCGKRDVCRGITLLQP